MDILGDKKKVKGRNNGPGENENKRVFAALGVLL